jgi:hypothetical protein
VIGDEGGHQRDGLRLLDKGTWRAFRRYRSPFEGLYVAQWALKDSRLAAWYGRVAKKRPDAPDWVPRMVAYVEIASGEFYIGYDRYLRNLLEAVDQNSVVLQDISLNKTAETILFWNASILADAVDRHTSGTGRLPSATMVELINDPILSQTEVASFPRMLAAVNMLAQRLKKDRSIEPGSFVRSGINVEGLMPAIQTAENEIRDEIMAIDLQRGSSLADYQQDIFRLSMVKRGSIPVDPYGYGMALNLALWGAEGRPLSDQLTSRRFINEEMTHLLRDLRASIKRRQEELGRNPADLREVFLTDFRTTEPLGGRWIYDPKDASLKSSSFPNL